MSTSVPRILFPLRERPLRALVARIGAAALVLLLVAFVTWLGRGGYRDADGTPVDGLDAFYYATVTLSTTGYGDITPISPHARLTTALVVTPARILFLILLVGTTIELLTDRFRQSRAERSWRSHVTNHVIVAGYGTTGRWAASSLLDAGTVTPADVVAIDQSERALDEARRAGFTVVQGDATRIAVLRLAGIERARALVVAPHRDDTATLVTLTARELSPGVTISAVVREVENAHLLEQSGADTVIVSTEAAGRLLGMATDHPGAVAVLEDLLAAGDGLSLVERPVATTEVAGPPVTTAIGLPIALLRAGRHIPFNSPEFRATHPDDVVVCVAS